MPRPLLTAQTSSTVATTQLTDTVYRADGTTATGTVLDELAGVHNERMG